VAAISRVADGRGGDPPGLFARRVRAAIGLFVASAALLAVPMPVLAHAQPVRADPPIGGSVAVAPDVLQVWFSEEVDPKEASLIVTGPDGSQVDLGNTAVDLYDPQRVHVTVSLKPRLGEGVYVVQWHTRSAIDTDVANGSFSFVVVGGAGSPVASPAASPAAASRTTPAAVAIGPTPIPSTSSSDESNFDARAFGLAVLAGVVAAIGIWLFWRLVRPKPAR
jgi:copper resistance protein C